MKLLTDISLDSLKGIGGLGGELGSFTGKDTTRYWFQDTISLAIGVMTVVGFIWFFFQIISAAITWLSSGGDKNKIQQAQKQITNGIVGLVIMISATLLVKLVEIILGINILSGITDLLQSI